MPKPIGGLYPGNPSHMQGHTKAQRKIYQANGEQNKAGVAILISDKIDFKATDQKRQRRKLHNGKRNDATRRANDPKYIHTQYRSTQIHKASS